MTSGKHPKCECGTTKYDYFKKIYRNGTLHMFRKCPLCQKVAQNAMRQDEYDANWLAGLPVMENGVIRTSPVETRAEPVRSTRKPSVRSPKSRVQTRADAIQEKLSQHIQSRNL